jgi:hypothetical protein
MHLARQTGIEFQGSRELRIDQELHIGKRQTLLLQSCVPE